MQINIRSSNIIIFKKIGDYLTKDEILKQAGFSLQNDDTAIKNVSEIINLGGGAFDGSGYQVTTPLVDSTIEWCISLPNGQTIDEPEHVLTLTLETDETQYHKLIEQKDVTPAESVINKLEVANHQQITLGKIKTTKPLPTVNLAVPSNYDMATVQIIVYPVVGSGTSVNKNLANYGITIVDFDKRLVTWTPKNQDLYPFGPSANEITSLVYVIQANKFKKTTNINAAWGFDPTELLANQPKPISDNANMAYADDASQVPNTSEVKSDNNQGNNDKSSSSTPLDNQNYDSKPVVKPTVQKSDDNYHKPVVQPVTKKVDIEWYKQGIDSLATNTKKLVNNITNKVNVDQKKPKAKTSAKTKKAKPVVKKKDESKHTSNHGIIKFIITVVIGLGLAGSGTYFWREKSLAPYQPQITAVKRNQDQINSLLDQKSVSVDKLQKAIQLASTNAKLIKQLPVSDHNIWRTRVYNQLEYQNEQLVAKAKKIQIKNEKQIVQNN